MAILKPSQLSLCLAWFRQGLDATACCSVDVVDEDGYRDTVPLCGTHALCPCLVSVPAILLLSNSPREFSQSSSKRIHTETSQKAIDHDDRADPLSAVVSVRRG